LKTKDLQGQSDGGMAIAKRVWNMTKNIDIFSYRFYDFNYPKVISDNATLFEERPCI